MHPRRVLIVEDDHAIQTLLHRVLESEGWEVAQAATGTDALSHLARQGADLVLTDLQLPDMDGVAVIERMLALDPCLTTIVMTGFGTVERAVEAMRAGAVDFIRKPFDLKLLVAAVNQAVVSQPVRRPIPPARAAATGSDRATGLVGESPAMRALVEFVRKVADSDSTVLIFGESGTGKEVLARTLHAQSRRHREPLVPVNCGAIPETLLESELFGHERGAFSGAHQARAGRFELAHGGTLFLDEIGEMPLPLQVKLLRALQERCFERVGGTRSVKVDVRIIAATNADLDAAVRDGRFRKDLYYRLNVIPITVPSLRQRRSDIPLLVRYFLQRLNSRKGASVLGVDDHAMSCLAQYDWPGNVRELENLIERLVVLKGEGMIEVADLPEVFHGARPAPGPRASVPAALSQEGIDLMMELEQYENHLILKALNQAGGITSKAARLLRLNRTTLVEKLKRKKLDGKATAEQDRTMVGTEPYPIDQPSMI